MVKQTPAILTTSAGIKRDLMVEEEMEVRYGQREEQWTNMWNGHNNTNVIIISLTILPPPYTLT